MVYDYVLRLEEDRLRVVKSEYDGPEISVGKLALVFDEDGDTGGRLQMVEETPIS